MIAGGAGSAFDPAVVRVFRRLVMPFPLGTEVTLPDGRVGVVAEVDPDRPYEPGRCRTEEPAPCGSSMGEDARLEEPGAQLRVHRRVVEEREVVRAADVQPVLRAERDPALRPRWALEDERRRRAAVRADGASSRVIVAVTKQWVASSSSGTSAHAAARRASGSQPSQSRSTSEPWRRSRIPALRRRRKLRERARSRGRAWSACAA